MNPAIDKLTKYLQLEAARGFDNRAIMGGLQRMLEPWQQEAQETGLSDKLIQVVTSRLRDYPDLSPQSRQEVLQGLLHRLRSEFSDLPIEALLQSEAEPATPEPKPPAEKPLTQGPVEPVSAVTSHAHEPQEHAPTVSPTASEPQEPGPIETAPPPHQPPPEVEPSKTVEEATAAALEAPLTSIPGIGPKSAKTLDKLRLSTLGDLLWHFPRRYDDYSQLKTINRLWYGEEVTIIATVESINVRPIRKGKMKLIEMVVSDGTASLRVTWFNQVWITRSLKPGQPVVLSGKVDQYLGRLTMNNPEWERLEQKQLHTNRIVPVYPLTAGVTAKWLRKVMHGVVTRLAPRLPDPLPESIRSSAKLLPLGQALIQVHFPDNSQYLKQAQERLAFDEMFLLQLGVLAQKQEWEALATEPMVVEDSWISKFLSALPYELTGPQHRALEDLRADLAAPRPMNRLMQGDVGSGKTVIAAIGMGIAAANNRQAAMLAPTSILAEQHYNTLIELLPTAAGLPPDSIRLLIGGTPEAEKEEIRAGLSSGAIRIVIGTHALLEDPVNFADLGYVAVDEQHRFGVEQRAVLRAKGDNPNLLVMSATPIPRSLSLTLYGDLDLSLIDELPPGRQPIETRLLETRDRNRSYSFIQGQLAKNRQAFIIYPLVEESENVDAPAAIDEHKRLQEEVFTEYKLGLLHGRLSADEKEAVMEQFRSGAIQVLVSTSVVELGIDVPNATVMLIEGANRFGLAQLHQFRGRVGRGPHASYCLLIPDKEDEKDNERLKAMESTSDGFKLAELDLAQRGPGDFLGTRQSGFDELRMASLTDVRLIEKARRQAERLFATDPKLQSPEHELLAHAVTRFWTRGKGEIS